MTMSEERNVRWAGMLIILVYFAGYLALRQTAVRATIFMTSGGPGAPLRGIILNPVAAKRVHLAYSPLIWVDRRWTGTVVTVNIP